MGGGEGETVSGGYARLRKALDDAGYQETLPLEALALVQHLYNDLHKTTHSLNKTLKQYAHYKQIAQELEAGVAPFKEENVKLIRENSHLRMEVVRSKEDFEDQLRGSRSRLRDLEAENTDLKLLINRFVEKVKKLEIESLVKTNKIAELQEKRLESIVIMPECSKKQKCNSRQKMEIDSFTPDVCPHCIRLKNYVEFDPMRDPNAVDYLKLTDSRIEALQLQIRSLKLAEKDMTQLVSSMKSKVEERDAEIAKLHKYVTVRSGSDNLANGMSNGQLIGDSRDMELQLKSAQMQLDMLQRRNINLEKKLKSSILQEHEDFMLGKSRTTAEKEFIRSWAELDIDKYPTHDEMNLTEKLKHLELQLSNCCKEKAELKAALDKCEEGRRRGANGTGSKSRTSFSPVKSKILADVNLSNKSRLESRNGYDESESGGESDNENGFMSDESGGRSSDGGFSENGRQFKGGHKLPSTNGSKGKVSGGRTPKTTNLKILPGERKDSYVDAAGSRKQTSSMQNQPLRPSLKSKSSSSVDLSKTANSSTRKRSSQSQPPVINTHGIKKQESKLNFTRNSHETSSQRLRSSPLLRDKQPPGSKSATGQAQVGSKVSRGKQQAYSSNKLDLSDVSEETNNGKFDTNRGASSKQSIKVSAKDNSRLNAERNEDEGPSLDLRVTKSQIVSSTSPSRRNLNDAVKDGGRSQIKDSKDSSKTKSGERSHIGKPSGIKESDKQKQSQKLAATGKSGSKSSKQILDKKFKSKKQILSQGGESVSENESVGDEVTEIYKHPERSKEHESKGQKTPNIGMPTKRESVRGTASDENMLKLKGTHGNASSTRPRAAHRSKVSGSDRESTSNVQYEESMDVEVTDMEIDTLDEVEGEVFPVAQPNPATSQSSQGKLQRQFTNQQSINEEDIIATSAWVTGQDRGKTKGLDSRGTGVENQRAAAEGSQNQPGGPERPPAKGTKSQTSSLLDQFHDLNVAVRQDSQDRKNVQQAFEEHARKVALERQKSKEDGRSRENRTEEDIEFAYGRAPIERPRGLSGRIDEEQSYAGTPMNVIHHQPSRGVDSELPSRKATHTILRGSREQEKRNLDEQRPSYQQPIASNPLRQGELQGSYQQQNSLIKQNNKEQRRLDWQKSTHDQQSSKEQWAPDSQGHLSEQPGSYQQQVPYDNWNPNQPRNLYEQRSVEEDKKCYEQRNPYDQFDDRQARDQQRNPYEQFDDKQVHDKQRNPYDKFEDSQIRDKHRNPQEQLPVYDQDKCFEEQNPNKQRRAYESQSYEQRQGNVQSNPYGQQLPSKQQTFEQRQAYGQGRPYEQQKAYDQGKPFEQQSSYEKQTSLDQRNPYQRNPSYEGQSSASADFQRNERQEGVKSSETRTIVRADERPSYSGMTTSTIRDETKDRPWLTRESGVEHYRKEIERLRADLFKKEDELDRLVQDKELLQGRITSLQSDLQVRRAEYPVGTQSIIKKLEEEREFLQNSLRQNQGKLRELERQVASQESAVHEALSLHNKLKDMEKSHEALRTECKQLGNAKIDLDTEVKKLRSELADCQADRQQWRNQANKTRSSLEQTEMLLSETQKRSSQSQLLPQRENFEMAQRLRQQAVKEQELEREIAHLRSSVKSLDRDKDEMRVELDRKDEKLARMNQDCEKHMSELSRLQLALKNAELQIGHTGETAKEHDREMIHMRRQIDTLKRDLEMIAKERDDTIRDCRRLAGAISKEEIERKSLNVELEKTSKEADELRKQLQKYIEEVRRIEDLLLQKEEEMETLIEHYRNLSLEKSTLETQRTSLEREATSIREDVREAVDQNITLKNQMASQNALIKSYEDEIERLTIQVSTVENQLSKASTKEKSSEADVKATRDLIFNLETKMDKLKLELANSESVKNKLEAENGEQKRHIELLEEQLEQEVEKQKRLEELIATVREKEFVVERSTQDLSMERNQLAERLTSLQSRTELLNDDVSKFRLKSIELQNELDRTKRQLQSEKHERETALAELRRVQEQLNTTSTNTLLNAALAGISSSSGGQASDFTPRFGHGLSTSGGHQQSASSIPFSPMSDAYLDSPLGASTTRDRDQEGQDGSNISGDGGFSTQN